MRKLTAQMEQSKATVDEQEEKLRVKEAELIKMTHAASNKDAKISDLEQQNTVLKIIGNNLNKGEVCGNVINIMFHYACVYTVTEMDDWKNKASAYYKLSLAKSKELQISEIERKKLVEDNSRLVKLVEEYKQS